MFKICVNQVNVHDIDQAIDFYSKKLGFEVATRDMYPHIVPLKNAGIYFILSKVEKPTKIDYPKESQSLINFQTDDLQKTIKDLKAAGVEFIHAEPQDCPAGIYAAFKDPSGNVHELIEFRQ